MLLSSCAGLKTLSKRLLELYEARNRTIVLPHLDADQVRAEYELIRMQKLITRHRQRCPQCKTNEIALHSEWSVSTANGKAPHRPFQSL